MKILLTAVAVTFAAGAVLAGEPATFGIGSRVRVQQEAGKQRLSQVGVIVATDAETLTLSLDHGHTRVVPWSEVRRLDISRGRRSVGAGMLRGAGFGLAAGLAVGTFLAIGERDDPPCPPSDAPPGFGFSGSLCFGPLFTAADKRTFDIAGMGLVGGSVGLAVGAVSRGERWQRAGGRIVHVSPTTDPRGHGAGLALSVSF